MAKIARNGDKGDRCGGIGKITGASSHFLCRGSIAAKDGDEYTCSLHGKQKCISSHHFTLNGESIVLVGDKTTCEAIIREGADGTDVQN